MRKGKACAMNAAEGSFRPKLVNLLVLRAILVNINQSSATMNHALSAPKGDFRRRGMLRDVKCVRPARTKMRVVATHRALTAALVTTRMSVAQVHALLVRLENIKVIKPTVKVASPALPDNFSATRVKVGAGTASLATISHTMQAPPVVCSAKVVAIN